MTKRRRAPHGALLLSATWVSGDYGQFAGDTGTARMLETPADVIVTCTGVVTLDGLSRVTVSVEDVTEAVTADG